MSGTISADSTPIGCGRRCALSAVAQPVRREGFGMIDMRDLRQRMHAGIGAARAVHAHRLAADRLDRGLQRALHGRRRCPDTASRRTARRHIR